MRRFMSVAVIAATLVAVPVASAETAFYDGKIKTDYLSVMDVTIVKKDGVRRLKRLTYYVPAMCPTGPSSMLATIDFLPEPRACKTAISVRLSVLSMATTLVSSAP